MWPAEYGGEAGTIEEIGTMWAEKLQKYKSFFADDVKYGVDDTKRSGKGSVNAESLFGVDGTFRQLNLF